VAELSPAAAQAVLGYFLREFNAMHGSAFALTESEPPSDASCDYLCRDADRSEPLLKVQLTRAVPSVETYEPDGGADALIESRSIHAWVNNRQARNRPSAIPDSLADSAVRALRLKAERLGPSAADLILLIFYDFQEIDEVMDLPEMVARMAVEEIPFKEVWAVWGFEDAPGTAHLLWPQLPSA
jgi:hypothetical protein